LCAWIRVVRGCDAEGMEALRRLIAVLRDKFRSEPRFRGTLEIAIEAPIGRDLAVDRSRSANVISGNVEGHIVQARDAQGGIRIGPVEDPASPTSTDGS
jgi:hypothetical protein